MIQFVEFDSLDLVQITRFRRVQFDHSQLISFISIDSESIDSPGKDSIPQF